jgi:urease accessory protein
VRTTTGSLAARFGVRAGRTALVGLRCQPPLQALRALERGAGAELVVATLGPGVMGGDELALAVEAGPGTDVRVGSTGATRVLPARAGRGAAMDVRLVVGEGARLAYLPRPTIVQAGALYRQRIEVELAAGARALIGEVMVPGRLARGERFEFVELDLGVEVRGGGGEVLVAERQRVVPGEADPTALGALPGGEIVVASLWVLAPGRDWGEVADALAERARGTVGVTMLPNRAGVLVRGLFEGAQGGEEMVGQMVAVIEG